MIAEIEKEITIPHNFIPRSYQLPIFRAMDNGILRGLLLWHRRGGKDKTCLNYMIKRMMKRVGIYYYFFPTYSQGKKILWDGIDGAGFKFLDHFPEELIMNKNSSEMKITLLNGSLFQIVGTDNYDSIVGTNPVGSVFSEFALQDPTAWDYMRPILLENKGWALFPYTPRGYNHGHTLYNMAMASDRWYCEKLTVEDTGVMTKADMAAEKEEGMSDGMIQQEYYCSFENIGGTAFAEISKQKHQVDIENPPDRLKWIFDFDLMLPKPGVSIFRSMDWGYSKPFSVGWYITDENNVVYRFKELYGCKDPANAPDVGIQMPAEEVAQEILKIEADFPSVPDLCIADASIWDKPGNQNIRKEKNPSIAETMESEGVYFDHELSKEAKKSRFQGKHQLHGRLRIDEDGLPGLMVFSNCVNWWRTVPLLPLDELKIEDVDTKKEDHAYDETRYLLSSRPFKTEKKVYKDPLCAEEIYEHYIKPNREARGL